MEFLESLSRELGSWSEEKWKAFGKNPGPRLKDYDMLWVLWDIRQDCVEKGRVVPWGLESPVEEYLLWLTSSFVRGVPARPVSVFTKFEDGQIVPRRLKFVRPKKMTCGEAFDYYRRRYQIPHAKQLWLLENGNDQERIRPRFVQIEKEPPLPDDKFLYRDWVAREVAYYTRCIAKDSKAALFHRFPPKCQDPGTLPKSYGKIVMQKKRAERLQYARNKPLKPAPPLKTKPPKPEPAPPPKEVIDARKNAPLDARFEDLPRINEMPLVGEAVFVPFELGLACWRGCKPGHWFHNGTLTVPAGDPEKNYSGWRRLLVEMRRDKIKTFRNRLPFYRDKGLVGGLGRHIYQSLQKSGPKAAATPGDGKILFEEEVLPPCIRHLLATKERYKNPQRLLLQSFLAFATDPKTKNRVSIETILRIIKDQGRDYYKSSPGEWESISKSVTHTYKTIGGYAMSCQKCSSAGLCVAKNPPALQKLGYSVQDIEDLGKGGCLYLTAQRGADDQLPCSTVQQAGARFTQVLSKRRNKTLS